MKNLLNHKFTAGSIPIITLVSGIESKETGGIDLQPDFQREFIWTDEFKSKLIYSLVQNYPIGNIILASLHEPSKKGAETEVVDGQQRLTTIFEFLNGTLVLSGEMIKEIVEVIKKVLGKHQDKLNDHDKKIYDKIEAGKYKKISFKELPSFIQNQIRTYPIIAYSFDTSNSYDRNELKKYFRFIQNQEKLRAGEIMQALPENIYEKYLDMVNFKNIISFPNKKRREFDKIYYSIIGLIEKKIPLGVIDKQIINFISNAKSIQNVPQIEDMNDNLNYIFNLESSDLSFNSLNKRGWKYILLISYMDKDFFKEDTSKKLEIINTINDKLSAFNSGIKNELEKKFGIEKIHENDEFSIIESQMIERYREIYLITKGAHNKSKVEKIIGTLIDEINERLLYFDIEEKNKKIKNKIFYLNDWSKNYKGELKLFKDGFLLLEGSQISINSEINYVENGVFVNENGFLLKDLFSKDLSYLQEIVTGSKANNDIEFETTDGIKITNFLNNQEI